MESTSVCLLHQFENINKIENKNGFYIIQATVIKNN